MQDSTTRRRALRWGSAAALGAVAGCLGGGTPTRVTAVDDGGDGDGATPTATAGSATATPIVTSFREDFSDGLTGFAVARKSARWTAEERIDGTSAHADASGAAGTSVLARRGGFRWAGTGTVSVRVQASTAYDNRNAFVAFGPVGTDAAWRAGLRLDGDQTLVVQSPDGETARTAIDLVSGAVHTLRVLVSTDTVLARVGADEEVRFDDPPSLPAGTVGLGIESRSGVGGAAWYDDLVVDAGG